MSYTNVFGGQPQSPSQVYLTDYSITGAITLDWPWSGTPSDYIMAKIVRINADDVFYDVYTPAANIASNGEATIFINTGANLFNINDSTGANITTVLAGQVKYIYLIDNSTAAGSWGVFTFGAGTSGADASALAGAGLQAIANTLNEELVVVDFSSSGFNLTSSSRAILYNWTGGSDTVTTDDPAALGAAWFAMIRNSGSGTLAVTPASGTIDGSASKNFQPGDTGYLIRDGANIITLGFGQSAAFAFDYVSINVAGTGTFVLNTAQQNRIAYNFTGLLTGNRGIQVPATVQQYWVTNATTGAFTLGVWTAAQGSPGVQVVQGDANILYCNGSAVVPGVSTTGVTLPVSIADGGTGATTATGAVSNLGGTATGAALFTAVSAAAARATLALGSIATQNANNVAITGGTITGITGPVDISGTAATEILLTQSDDGATAGPNLDLYRISASPAASDIIGRVLFSGRNSSAAKTTYAIARSVITSPTAAAESATLSIQTLISGAISERIAIGNGLYLAGATGGDQGAGTINAVDYYHNGSLFYETGTFTPTLRFGGAAVGMTISIAGEFTRIGNICIARIRGILTAKGSSTGNASLNALPFTAASSNLTGATFYPTSGTWSSLSAIQFLPVAGGSTSAFITQIAASAVATLTDANFSNNSAFSAVIIYQV